MTHEERFNASGRTLAQEYIFIGELLMMHKVRRATRDYYEFYILPEMAKLREGE